MTWAALGPGSAPVKVALNTGPELGLEERMGLGIDSVDSESLPV